MTQTLVVVIHRYRQDSFGLLLTDHILIEQGRDFLGRRQVALDALAALVTSNFVANNIVAQLNTCLLYTSRCV